MSCIRGIGTKGGGVKEGIHKFRHIILLILFLVIVFMAGSATLPELRESNQAEHSAFILARAIQEVHRQAVDFNNYDYKTYVNVTLPGEGKEFSGFRELEESPVWIVYTGYEVSDIRVAIGPKLERRGQFCTGLCYGFARRTDLPEFDLENALVERFFLVNPCKAQIEVYYADGKVRLRLLKNEQSDQGNNYCCDRNSFFHQDEDDWPDSDLAFQSNGRGCFV